ncbi:HAMP domain-containing histidine kinase [bacterium]|nr:HAMP domain-containing histidine kinase [bacterium]
MLNISDTQLLKQLKQRFDENSQNLLELKRASEALKKMNDKLVVSEAMKSDFLSNIRNEINNPLTVILGLSQTLYQEGYKTDEAVSSMGQIIFKEAWDLDFQLRTIFAAAEIEAGEARVHISEVDIEVSMKRLINSFQSRLDEKSMKINLNMLMSSIELKFITDSEKLQLIMSNLLSNAIEFGYSNSNIDIEISNANNELLLSITNKGAEIKEEDYGRIFDRFVQLDTGLTKAYKGHGLGLAVVKGATELLEGSLSVKSNSDGHTIFSICIPELKSDEEKLPFSEDGNEMIF